MSDNNQTPQTKEKFDPLGIHLAKPEEQKSQRNET